MSLTAALESRARAAVLALGADAETMRVLYTNAFESVELSPRGAPVGEGLAVGDVELAGPQHYRVARARFPDGRAGVRLVTKTEQPGGYDYSNMSAYAHFRRRFMREPVVAYAWSVHLPLVFDFTERSGHWENRVLWTSAVENKRELARLRFLDNRSLVFEVAGERKGSHIPLANVPASGERVDVVLALRRTTGDAIALVGDELIGESVALGHGMAIATVDSVMSTGNVLKHDTDVGFFAGLSSLAAFRAGP